MLRLTANECSDRQLLKLLAQLWARWCYLPQLTAARRQMYDFGNTEFQFQINTPLCSNINFGIS